MVIFQGRALTFTIILTTAIFNIGCTNDMQSKSNIDQTVTTSGISQNFNTENDSQINSNNIIEPSAQTELPTKPTVEAITNQVDNIIEAINNNESGNNSSNTTTPIKPITVTVPPKPVKPPQHLIPENFQPIPQETFLLQNSWPQQVQRAIQKEGTRSKPMALPECSGLNSFLAEFGCSVTGKYGRSADVKIFLANPNKKEIHKVAFILAPHNFGQPRTINREAKYTAHISNANKVYEELQKKGVSVAFIAYGHKNYYLKKLAAKSSATAKAIRLINQLKQDNSSSLLMGLSLGGVIGRMALREMEINNEDHNVSHYISFDSPHQGAHVALGLQHLMRFLKVSTQHAVKQNRRFRNIFGDFIDKILNLDNISNALDNGIQSGQTVSNQVKLFSDVFLTSEFAQELIIQQLVNIEQGYFNPKFTASQRHLQSLGLPKETSKNVGITNGSIAGQTVPLNSDYYVALHTPLRNYTQIVFKSYIARSDSPYIFNGVLKYPDPTELGGLFGGDGTDKYTYRFHNQRNHLNLDKGSCGYIDAVADIEKEISNSVQQHFGARLDVKNRKMCFIPITSALAARKNISFKGRITAQESLFDEIIGGVRNTPHLAHTPAIVQGLQKIIQEAYNE